MKRSGAGAAPLPDGRVLVVGGNGQVESPDSAEIYDPTTGEFSPTGAPLVPRWRATAVALPDGMVLVTGSDASAEIYDPLTGTFAATGSMVGSATYIVHGAALSDGSVLVFADSGISEARPHSEYAIEQYEPSAAAFATVPLASPARSGLSVAALPGGRALVAGGTGEGPTWLGHEVKPTAQVFVSAPSPSSAGLDFGEVTAGEGSGPETLTITNQGAQGLEVEAATLTGADAAEFEIVADGCSDETIAYGEACGIEIEVTPAAAGSLSAAVELTDNAPSSPQSFSLAAEATAQSPAAQAGDEAESPEATPAPGDSPQEKSTAGGSAAVASSPPSGSSLPASGSQAAKAKRACRRPTHKRRGAKSSRRRCGRRGKARSAGGP
jgi:hypothetical protein